MTELIIGKAGDIKCLYNEEIPLRDLGELSIDRASYVEPDARGNWWCDLSPSGGDRIGPFLRRSDAITAEQMWLTRNVMTPLLSSG